MSDVFICENSLCMKTMHGPFIQVARHYKQGKPGCSHLFLACSWSCIEAIAKSTGLSQSEWHIFDKDDENTWPQDRAEYWTVSASVFDGKPWTHKEKWVHGVDPLGPWDHITHWQPIVIPEPPA